MGCSWSQPLFESLQLANFTVDELEGNVWNLQPYGKHEEQQDKARFVSGLEWFLPDYHTHSLDTYHIVYL